MGGIQVYNNKKFPIYTTSELYTSITKYMVVCYGNGVLYIYTVMYL